jgi:amidase
MGIKDLNLARGMFARFGSRAFERFMAFADDATTAQLRRGGFVILGKTTTSELGTMPVTETDIHPPTRNPWNPEHTSGGSSGGSGAAVAARMLPIAQASDGAGSIRIPASFNGLVGIKPSRGRVRNSFDLDDRRIIYTTGPLARSVEDVAAMLDVMAGIVVGEPHWASPPDRPYARSMHDRPRGLRVRTTTHSPLAETHPEVVAATKAVAALLASMGHHVEEGKMVEGTVEEFLPIWQFQTASAPVYDWNLAQPVTRWLADSGRRVTQERVDEIQVAMQARILDWFAGADLWVTPTVPAPPPRVGAWKHLPPAEAFARAAELGPFTAPFNVSGQPAISVPVAISSGGLPIGVQIVGPPLRDDLVLQIARAIEEAMPNPARRPPGF